MATTERQRRGADKFGFLAGLTGGPAFRTGEELRALLGPLSTLDLERINVIYRTGYERGKRERQGKDQGSGTIVSLAASHEPRGAV